MAYLVAIPERAGRCRWCGCTHDKPCPEGCWWANRAQTLCSACVSLDAMLKTAAGRQRLATLVQLNGQP